MTLEFDDTAGSESLDKIFQEYHEEGFDPNIDLSLDLSLDVFPPYDTAPTSAQPVGIDNMMSAFEIHEPQSFASDLTSTFTSRNSNLVPSIMTLSPSRETYGSVTSPPPMAVSYTTTSSFSQARSPSVGASFGTSLNSRSLSKAEKNKKRKESHNEVERRRRDQIKNGIAELSSLVPTKMLKYNSEGNVVKSNKARTLTKTIEYIKELERIVTVQMNTRQKLMYVKGKLIESASRQ